MNNSSIKIFAFLAAFWGTWGFLDASVTKARAEDSEAMMDRAISNMESLSRSETSRTQELYNPPASAYYPPVESTLQNWEFQNKSYR
jgi:hypothetical protein